MGAIVDLVPDGMPIADVGPWARDKLALIREYIKISRSARRKYVNRTEATYIDLWCGPGLSRIRGTREYLCPAPRSKRTQRGSIRASRSTGCSSPTSKLIESMPPRRDWWDEAPS